ncbi:MAG: TorF family putative porin [Comamonadaceae bacterium]|jgi:uncharacterized protein (TIGR02001 family)|nr:TorF family putative porin [Comamonadaceae bacterium]
MKYPSLKTLGLALAAAFPVLASAQWSANVSLTTNYKFRGQDQDASRSKAIKPALQGGFDYTFGESGWYLGNWNSSVNWLQGNSLEMDFYGGYKFKVGEVDGDLGALTYVYPGNSTGNTTELYGAASYGPFTAKYAHTVSADYFGLAGSGAKGRNTGYLNLAYSQEVLAHTTLKATVGYTRFASGIHDQGVPHYVDYSLGASYDFGSGLALGAAVAGATQKDYFGDGNKARLIVTLSKTL